MVVFLYIFYNEHGRFELKTMLDANLTISTSQCGGFSTSSLVILQEW